MELIYSLLSKYYEEEKRNIIIIICVSVITSFIQTNAISHFNAKIITALHDKNFTAALSFFKLFMFVWIVFMILSYVYESIQNLVLCKLRQWIRFESIQNILISTNNEMRNVNFTRLATPISRISTTCFYYANIITSHIIPNLMFVVASMASIAYYNHKIGAIFFIGNLIWISLLYYKTPVLRTKSQIYEQSAIDTENHIVEVLNNMDKVVSRGKTETETTTLRKFMDDTISYAYTYYTTVTNTLFIINSIVLLTVFICTGYSMYMLKNKEIDITIFITLFTLLILFREKVYSIAQQISNIIETVGRAEAIESVLHPFKKQFISDEKSSFPKQNLTFESIDLTNVYFKYDSDTGYIFEDKTISLETTNHNILGIVGLSGNGKSTIAKLILKLHPIESGNLTIDGVDISTIDPDYIRHNVTYINQNSRLFDKTVYKNIMYGCSDDDMCKKHYEHILTYPKIRELFADVDLTNTSVGYSGEKISGGQRQITNIISGLVTPTKILILDEPTNALDKDLKMELLEIIKYFKNHIQCIIIITHDSDVYPLFTQKISV